jgi:dolichol-phosphate mannosyltransferase
MNRVLITGGTGFVGANLVRRLLRDGHEVHLLVGPGHCDWRIREIAGDVRLWPASLGDAEAVAAVVRRVRPQWVFHLAVYGAYPAQQDLRRMIDTNLSGTACLLDACLREGFETLVNTGSSSEYGAKDHAPPEDELLEPNSHYAVTKAAATHLCRYTARRHGVRIPTLRLYSVYGPYEEPTRLFPALVVRGLSGGLPPLVRPDVARDYVYAGDVAAAYLAAAGSPLADPGAVFNVGTGVQTTIAELVALVRREFGIDAEPQWGSLDQRPWDTSTWIADCRKIEAELGWVARVPVADGFRRTVAWFREDAERIGFYRQRQGPTAPAGPQL